MAPKLFCTVTPQAKPQAEKNFSWGCTNKIKKITKKSYVEAIYFNSGGGFTPFTSLLQLIQFAFLNRVMVKSGLKVNSRVNTHREKSPA
jgi:hypothetical protein